MIEYWYSGQYHWICDTVNHSCRTPWSFLADSCPILSTLGLHLQQTFLLGVLGHPFFSSSHPPCCASVLWLWSSSRVATHLQKLWSWLLPMAFAHWTGSWSKLASLNHDTLFYLSSSTTLASFHILHVSCDIWFSQALESPWWTSFMSSQAHPSLQSLHIILPHIKSSVHFVCKFPEFLTLGHPSDIHSFGLFILHPKLQHAIIEPHGSISHLISLPCLISVNSIISWSFCSQGIHLGWL